MAQDGGEFATFIYRDVAKVVGRRTFAAGVRHFGWFMDTKYRVGSIGRANVRVANINPLSVCHLG